MLLMKRMLIWAISILFPFLGLAQTIDVKTDTMSKGNSRMSKPKPYKEVITAKAITDVGLFKVHKVEDKYYFEIPDSLLDRDILIVSRIVKGAVMARSPKDIFGYAGDKIGENVVQFAKGPNNKLFIKSISYLEISKDTTDNGLYRSVLNSNLQPIVAAFDIKAFSPDSTGVVIDMTDYINGDNDVLFFEAKGSFGISTLQGDKSYIETVRSFPVNIEIETVKTYTGTAGAKIKTMKLNSSLVLLPKEPMRPRYSDKRVGYFAAAYKDFDANPQGVENTNMITRWRLEPKEEDIEKYKKGEPVEPEKPIVFYIDPTTPKKWVPYLIQGINDWQKAFEKAGFKNAIYALEAPTNDPEWSLEDARHNAIIYKPSDIPNASGPHVHDPRSGEILETHVNWYHNVMQLLHDWYMIQAGAIDPRARKMEFDDSLMGELIRFVSSHEVGHTLGLTHNFGSSSTVSVDSLRNKKWVEANGHTPSIMDYARFNYIAQPEDSISEKGIFPRIGVYDEWAIEWGYKWLPDLKTKQEEKVYLNKWIIDRTSKDKRLWFGSEGSKEDPRCQSEDLGDNAVKAGGYGIKNLKRIMPHLTEWTKEPAEGYEGLRRIQRAVYDQYTRYLFHVSRAVGGIYFTPLTVEQLGLTYEFPSKNKQKEAVQFIQKALFTAPIWLQDKKLFALTGFGSAGNILIIQKRLLNDLLSYRHLEQFKYAAFYEPENAYMVEDLLDDMKAGIWSELKEYKIIDSYRRNLQKNYVNQVIEDLEPIEKIPGGYIEREFTTDISSIIRGHLKELLKEINTALPRYKEGITKLHLEDVRSRLVDALKSKVEKIDSPSATSGNTLSLYEEVKDNEWNEEINY